MSLYNEYESLDLPAINREIAAWWEENKTFQKSLDSRANARPFVFYEGPPSANGKPGIHHVLSRTIKDIFCRYKTQQGFLVNRKSGWDTHGLPIELQVEKKLGINKDDIGKSISVADYNRECRQDVMEFTGLWEDLTRKMGYWVDLQNPYVTYDNAYIETLWHLLKRLYDKDLLYKGYTIQPFSPAAGTGLSSHELNQPGTYKMVKDTTVVAWFEIDRAASAGHALLERITQHDDAPFGFLAWTTTPWTLPSNTALAVGKNISYSLIRTFNPYTGLPIQVLMAADRVPAYFNENNRKSSAAELSFDAKNLGWVLLDHFTGESLAGLRYHSLLGYAKPEEGDAWRVLVGDFVTTEDGTGIVHIAPSFGADDFRVAKQNGIGALTLVDRSGKFTAEVSDFAGEFVKEQYLSDEEKSRWCETHQRDKYLSVDERIAIKLKTENKAFKVEKYEHNYPHCWRTDKPILYYPLDSWFIRTTRVKDRLVELNKTIHWKPESTGTGRFGNWLENLVDWNLSRSRYWGTPLPIWSTEDGSERLCIGSIAELEAEIQKSVSAGHMSSAPNITDLHRPYVDEIVLVSPSGKAMRRETDLIDVWFDSGAMPYAQLHYPFENAEAIEKGSAFPADFIAEGVDQTRGWFFTLHALAVMLFDSVAFKTVVSNGLVLDKNGNKMSKRLGNAVDPFETLDKYGADPVRWYMVTNAQPWDNLKFDLEGIKEVQRKFFGTLYNTYSFFALYANIDGFQYKEAEIPVGDRPEIDRWVISLLNSLIQDVTQAYEEYEPTRAGRLIQAFVDENLSNWYVRLCRRRFWKGEMGMDKLAAYQTLYRCLEVLSQLMAPLAPFFAERLYGDLNRVTGRFADDSVHLAPFPKAEVAQIDKALEDRMAMAQTVSSLVLSLRKRENIRVRQPLSRILLPVLSSEMQSALQQVEELILAEVNVKRAEYITDTSGVVTKKIKPNFKKLGAKVGNKMKELSALIAGFSQNDIAELEKNGVFNLSSGDWYFDLILEDVEILSEDIPGWLVASEGKITVALDIHLDESLIREGLARELVNRIQNLRKSSGFEVTDRIRVQLSQHPALEEAVNQYREYISNEVLADDIQFSAILSNPQDLDMEEFSAFAQLEKVKG